jgi:putative nucleotidyltransferase with HDIG domain
MLALRETAVPITREELCSRIGELPTLPFIAAKLLDTLADENSSAVDVARIIASDQATSTRLLRFANSSYFSLGRRIATVRDAIVLIGYEGVRRMALGIAVIDSLGKGTPTSGLDFTRLWLHAIGVGTAARDLAPIVRANGEEAFIGGLLHDVGKVIMAAGAPQTYSEALRAAGQGMSIRDGELSVFGFSHCDVAALILAEWQFPERVVHAASLHHTPAEDTPSREMVMLVHAGDCLVRQAGLGYPGDEVVPEIVPWVAERLYIAEIDLAEFTARLTTQTRERWTILMPSA